MIGEHACTPDCAFALGSIGEHARAGRKQSSPTLTRLSLSAPISYHSAKTSSILRGAMSARLCIRQLFDRASCTFTYIVVDPVSMEAAIIDPVISCVDRDIEALEGLGVTKLRWMLNTHVHADHVTGTARLRSRPAFSSAQSVLSAASGAVADRVVEPGEKIELGSRHLVVAATPGHTPGCVTFVADDLSAAFTGDALMIRGCGRTDFQGGDAAQLYDSVWREIFSLPPSTDVWTGHDYAGRLATTVAEEMKHNPRLTKTKDEFVALMHERFDGSTYPGKIDEALPANMVCGVYEAKEDGSPCWDPATGTPVAHPGGFVWTPRDAAADAK